MKKTALPSLFLSAALLISGTSSANEIVENTAKKMNINNNKANEIKSLEKTLATWIDAFNNKDIEALFTLYDPDTLYSNPDSPVLIGIDEVKSWYETAFPQITGTLKYKQEVITLEGNMAVIVLKFYIKPDIENKAEEAFKGRAMLVFRKSDIGKWLLLFDMDNSPPDVLIKDFE